MNRKRIESILALACIGLFLGPARAAESAKPVEGDPYLLDYCVVSGQKLGSMGEPVVYDHEVREVRFCCDGCLPKFKESPTTYTKRMDEAMVEQQKPYYPLDTCVISGEKLGSMGEPVDVVYKNRLVRFCCAGCIGQFKKDAAAHLGKLDEAVVKAQRAAYPLETCVVTGQQLGSMGDPVDYVVGNRLVRFCCAGCESAFLKDPVAHLAKIDAARSGGESPASAEKATAGGSDQQEEHQVHGRMHKGGETKPGGHEGHGH